MEYNVLNEDFIIIMFLLCYNQYLYDGNLTRNDRIRETLNEEMKHNVGLDISYFSNNCHIYRLTRSMFHMMHINQ